MKKKKLFLLDVFPILYRSHFAMKNQHLFTTSGLNTSAILGFCNYIFQIIFKEKPNYIAAAFDSYSLERSSLDVNYKANREKMPEEIAAAKKYITEIIDALNLKVLKEEGFEADDVIGTVAKKVSSKGDTEVFIVSSDKDFAQLVDENIFLYRPSYQGVNFDILDAVKVKGKFGVPPEQIADLLALKGDPVDNIGGVPKIGEKTAVELLSKYQNIEEILDKREEITKASIRQSLIDNEESARLSKALAVINTKVPIKFEIEDLKLAGPNTEKLVELLDELEFTRLKDRIFSNSFYKKFFDYSLNQKSEEQGEADCNVTVVEEKDELESLLQKVKEEKVFSFLSKIEKETLTLSFLLEEEVYTINSSINEIPKSLKEILLSENVLKLTYNSKPISKTMIEQKQPLNGSIYDILLKHYIISPDANHQLDKILAQELGVSINTSDKGMVCSELHQLKALKEKWESDQNEKIQKDLYKKIDLPLLHVIGRMELNGIKLDTEALKDITITFKKEIKRVEERIFEIAGQELNLRSSKQTGELLSKILKNAPVKKTKTGQVSTSEATLLDYAEEYEVAKQLLRFRKLTKLVSTYTESLPTYINPKTGRVHADFLQVSTATGRLSCNNPNLQNLPIRSEEGREVRRAVIPENEDFLILSADYSQIELRLLAGLSKDEGLAKAFASNEDVHTITAAKVFNVAESEVSDDMRSKAKMVNYGIAYGISAFGLSQRLKISVSEGKYIIDHYFIKFPGINQFIENTIKEARENGFTETITGRKRYIEGINSRNGTERKAAERIAINAPIQGLAADLIKISMIDIDKEFQKRKLKSKMILQVHDELVFEVFKPELKIVTDIVKKKMEKAIDINVPIEVNIGVGKNWLELEETDAKMD